jgi:hypothetical protein
MILFISTEEKNYNYIEYFNVMPSADSALGKAQLGSFCDLFILRAWLNLVTH